MNLIDAITRSVERRPDAAAFIYNDKPIFYRGFYATLCLVAQGLHERGIKPGDVVALHLGFDPLHCIAVLALARLGAISIPMEPAQSTEKKRALVRRFGVAAVLTMEEEGELEGARLIKLAGFPMDKSKARMDFVAYMPDGDTHFRMSLTSGKTGDPKGQLLTQAYQLDRIAKTMHDCDADSRAISFPLEHPLGLTVALGVLIAGGTLVFGTEYTISEMMRALDKHDVTHIFASPVIARKMLETREADAPAIPSLRHLRLIGGMVPDSLLSDVRRRLTPNIFVGYGMSEVGPIALATPETLRDAPRSTGRVLPWVSLEIVDAHGTIQPSNAVGEIRVRLDGMPTAYHGDDETTRKKFRDGWLYTGDLGSLGEDGLLYIESRVDEVINLGGPKVNLVWLEEILARHADVVEAVAFALDAADGPECLAAALVVRPGAAIDQIREFGKQNIGWAHPRALFIMQELPRNAAGKILRAEVLARANKMRAGSTKQEN